jgi:hypothetical protein
MNAAKTEATGFPVSLEFFPPKPKRARPSCVPCASSCMPCIQSFAP